MLRSLVTRRSLKSQIPKPNNERVATEVTHYTGNNITDKKKVLMAEYYRHALSRNPDPMQKLFENHSVDQKSRNCDVIGD